MSSLNIPKCENSKRGNNSYVYDVIVVHGGGIHEINYKERVDRNKKNKTEKIKLSFNSKIRTLAAERAYRLKLAPILVFTGGHTLGSDYSSEAEAMLSYYKKVHINKGLERKAEEYVILEELSRDTSANLRNVLSLIQKYKWSKIALLTNKYHLNRVLQLANNFELDVEGIAAEDLLSSYSSHFEFLFDKYNKSNKMKIGIMKEFILRFLLNIDSKGNIPFWIAERTRR